MTIRKTDVPILEEEDSYALLVAGYCDAHDLTLDQFNRMLYAYPGGVR